MPCIKYCNRLPVRAIKTKCRAGLDLFFLLVLAATVSICPADSRSEMISGTVLSLDREEHKVVLAVPTDAGGTGEVIIRTDAPLPPCAEPGATMRAWGSYDDTKESFVAHDLRGPGRRLGRDPTGVRSRLHKYHRSGGSSSTRRGGSRRSGSRRHRRSR